MTLAPPLVLPIYSMNEVLPIGTTLADVENYLLDLSHSAVHEVSYYGQWHNDKSHGQGTICYSNGCVRLMLLLHIILKNE